MGLDFRAVDDLDLHVKKGEIYGLLGPNGAGKTTAIKALVGLLKMTAGSAEILDVKLPSKDIAPRIGYMPQETAMYLGLTVHQNMEFFGKLFGMSNGQIAEGEGIYITLGNLYPQDDGTVQLPIFMLCGGLCALGKTYVLSHIEGAWQITGSTGIEIMA